MDWSGAGIRALASTVSVRIDADADTKRCWVRAAERSAFALSRKDMYASSEDMVGVEVEKYEWNRGSGGFFWRRCSVV